MRSERLIAVMALAVLAGSYACSGNGSNQEGEPTLPLATNTPELPALLRDALLPVAALGDDWQRIPPDARVTRFEGDETTLSSPCARGLRIHNEAAEGIHYAGAPAPGTTAPRPQWYQTIALFESEEWGQDYVDEARLRCEIGGFYEELPFPRFGNTSTYAFYGIDEPSRFQQHHLVFVRRGELVMQIEYNTYDRATANPDTFERLVASADVRLLELASKLGLTFPRT